MMLKLHEVPDRRNDTPKSVWVNPDHVVRVNDAERSTLVEFADDYILVIESAEIIAQAINDRNDYVSVVESAESTADEAKDDQAALLVLQRAETEVVTPQKSEATISMYVDGVGHRGRLSGYGADRVIDHLAENGFKIVRVG